jgi:hypothetical protein
LTVKINSDWFIQKMKEKDISLRRLAPKIKLSNGRPMDPGSLSRTLKGERKLLVHEAQQIADLLGVDIDDVMKNAGHETSREIRLIAAVTENGQIKTLPSRQMVPLPPGLPHNVVAIQFRTSFSALARYDGFMVYCEELGPIRSEMLKRLCVVFKKDGKAGFAFVTQGYYPGTVNLLPEYNCPLNPEQNVEVVKAGVVLDIRPPNLQGFP